MAPTVIETVTVLESRLPSFALYVKESLPLKFPNGVYVNPPPAPRVSNPFAGSLTLISRERVALRVRVVGEHTGAP